MRSHFSCVWLFATLWTVAHQAPLPMGILQARILEWVAMPSSFSQFSSVRLFATPWTAGCQGSLSITNSWSLLKLTSFESVMPSNHLILCHPLFFLPSIFPSINFSNESVLHIDGQSIRVSASVSVLPTNIQDWFPLDELVWSPCSPKDSQRPSPTSQSKSINSSALSFLYDPTLTSIHDYQNIFRLY